MTKEELAEVLRLHGMWVRSEAAGVCADLHGANLYGADLSCADLSCADLSCADLSRADLSRADLHGADLHGANLYGANLYGAHLSGAKNIFDGGQDARGYRLVAVKTDDGFSIYAGCRSFPSFDAALDHWKEGTEMRERVLMLQRITARE